MDYDVISRSLMTHHTILKTYLAHPVGWNGVCIIHLHPPSYTLSLDVAYAINAVDVVDFVIDVNLLFLLMLLLLLCIIHIHPPSYVL